MPWLLAALVFAFVLTVAPAMLSSRISRKEERHDTE